MKSAERRGIEIGEKRGIEIGEERGEKRCRQTAIKEVVAKMAGRNMSPEDIAEFLELDLSEVQGLTKE